VNAGREQGLRIGSRLQPYSPKSAQWLRVVDVFHNECLAEWRESLSANDRDDRRTPAVGWKLSTLASYERTRSLKAPPPSNR